MNVSVNPDVMGSIEINGDTALSYPVVRNFLQDSYVRVKAKPIDGYKFIGWSGDLDGTENPTTIVAHSDMHITANFSRIMHTLTVSYNYGGKNTSIAMVYECYEGFTIDVITPEIKGWRFDGWIDDVTSQYLKSTRIFMDSDKDVTANFVRAVPNEVLTGIVGGVIVSGLVAFFITKHK